MRPADAHAAAADTRAAGLTAILSTVAWLPSAPGARRARRPAWPTTGWWSSTTTGRGCAKPWRVVGAGCHEAGRRAIRPRHLV